MMNRISIAGISLLALSPIAASAQTGGVGGGFGGGTSSGTGSYTIARQCDNASASLGFSFGVTIARGSVSYNGSGNYVRTPRETAPIVEEPVITAVDEAVSPSGKIRVG